MKDIIEFIGLLCTCIVIFIGISIGIAFIGWKIDLVRSACTEVVIDGKVQYRGKSVFYKTKSRGTATLYQEYEPVFFIPKMKAEIITDNIKVKTIGC